MVIADTSVWIPFFNRPDSPEKMALDMLIDADEVALVGVVLAELLQGCRTLSERTTLSEALLALRYYEFTQATWLRTGDLSAHLLRKGITLPLSDLLIAALAIEHDCRVYSLDAHFKKIPGVHLYVPASV
ncbi:MAG: PIN domain-containing protein [Nitrospira sp.]|nr:PIN domain-containing protein [Nitrospira sp.]